MQAKTKREIVTVKLSDITCPKADVVNGVPGEAELLGVEYDASKQQLVFIIAGSKDAAYAAEGVAPQSQPGKLTLEYVIS